MNLQSKKLIFIPIIICLLFILGANFYSYELWDYYFIAIIPLVYIILAYGLTKLWVNITGKIFVILVLSVFSIFNLRSFVNYVDARMNRAESNELINPDMLLKDQLDLLDFVKIDSTDAGGARFEYVLQSANGVEVYNYLINLVKVKTRPGGDIIYLVVDPRTLNLKDKLKGYKILLDQNFGSLRLIKYQVVL